jgi:hypothetical protein
MPAFYLTQALSMCVPLLLQVQRCLNKLERLRRAKYFFRLKGEGRLLRMASSSDNNNL